MSALESRELGNRCAGTYSFEVVDFAYAAHGFCGFDNRNCLDGDAVTEAGAFAVYDTWDEDVGLYTVFLASFDDLVVRTDSLSPRN